MLECWTHYHRLCNSLLCVRERRNVRRLLTRSRCVFNHSFTYENMNLLLLQAQGQGKSSSSTSTSPRKVSKSTAASAKCSWKCRSDLSAWPCTAKKASCYGKGFACNTCSVFAVHGKVADVDIHSSTDIICHQCAGFFCILVCLA